MRINYNISAMTANNSLQKNDKNLTTSLERLSSGFKINHAKDNASGLAMAKRMNAQIRSLEVANQNSSDGVSVIQIAEGALAEIEEMIQRMSELAVKASNGTVSDDDRSMIDDEIKQLKSEIERVADTTMYNGKVLLNGDYDVKGYTDNDAVKVVTYSDEVRSGDYVIDSLDATFDANGDIATCNMTLGAGFPTGCTVETKENFVYVTGSNEFEMQFELNGNGTPINVSPVKLDITGLGAMKLQTGTNEGQQLGVRVATINLKMLGLEKVDVSTEERAKDFLGRMDEALFYVNKARSRLGAYENRLEHTIKTLDISEENMTGAYSRIMDADMAEEMTEYTKNQVLVQSSTSMLAQANERPSSVLQLLQ